MVVNDRHDHDDDETEAHKDNLSGHMLRKSGAAGNCGTNHHNAKHAQK